jgi:hypothetical protein
MEPAAGTGGLADPTTLRWCPAYWPEVHSVESTVRYLGTDVDDAVEISEQTEI